MKIFVLNRNRLLVLGACIVVGALTLMIGLGGARAAISVANTKKDVPIYCVDTKEKKASISFDAAWGNEQTATLLDTLDKYNVKTTFFVVGAWVDKYPESVKEIQERGHEVCNHSNTHAHMTQISHDKQLDEISKCNEKIASVTGQMPTLFRAPYGEYNNQVLSTAKELNMYTIQWDIDSLDWKDPSPTQMKERISKKLNPGSIILLHNGAKNTPEALPMIIESIQNAGYEIIPISQIIYKDSYTIDNAGKQILNSQ